ncbi:MAG: glycosyltransferase family 9 protein [Chloroflexi bacterium]|nr:glycosyltransferase family 9 protein [Chloroflexota bacterium]
MPALSDTAQGGRLREQLLRAAEHPLRGRVRARPGQIRRVLLIRPDHLGDVLLTSVAVGWLRRGLPDAELTELVGPWSLDVARHGPAGVRVQVLPFPGFGRTPNPSLVAPYALLLRVAAQLRHADYDAAVVFRPDHWWGALLALAAGIPIRLGFAVPGTDRFLTNAEPLPHLPAAEQSLRLAERLLALAGAPGLGKPDYPVFCIGDDERRAASVLWQRHQLDGRQVVAIQPTAGARLKRWPGDWWAQVADILGRAGSAVVLTGGPGDADALSAVAASMTTPAAAMLADLPLGVAAAVFERCALLIGLDGGAAHLAAAVRTPTVRLYGPADRQVFGPWPRDAAQRSLAASLACVPCGVLEHPPCGANTEPACLLALTPHTLAAACLDLLERST